MKRTEAAITIANALKGRSKKPPVIPEIMAKMNMMMY